MPAATNIMAAMFRLMLSGRHMDAIRKIQLTVRAMQKPNLDVSYLWDSLEEKGVSTEENNRELEFMVAAYIALVECHVCYCTDHEQK